MDLATWGPLTELNEMIRALRRDRNPLKGLDCATHAWFLCKDWAELMENVRASLMICEARRHCGGKFAQAGTDNHRSSEQMGQIAPVGIIFFGQPYLPGAVPILNCFSRAIESCGDANSSPSTRRYTLLERS
jgi:hypothetical protein